MKVFAFCLVIFALTACHQTKPKDSATKQYAFTGKVISINLQDHTAMIDGAAIPNFMDAMKMDYPVPSNSDLQALKAGESIAATVNVRDDGTYSLTNIHEVGK